MLSRTILASPHQDSDVLVSVTISVLCSGCSTEHAIAYLVAGNCQAQRYLVWVGSFKGTYRESCGVEERGRCQLSDVDGYDPIRTRGLYLNIKVNAVPLCMQLRLEKLHGLTKKEKGRKEKTDEKSNENRPSCVYCQGKEGHGADEQ